MARIQKIIRIKINRNVLWTCIIYEKKLFARQNKNENMVYGKRACTYTCSHWQSTVYYCECCLFVSPCIFWFKVEIIRIGWPQYEVYRLTLIKERHILRGKIGIVLYFHQATPVVPETIIPISNYDDASRKRKCQLMVVHFSYSSITERYRIVTFFFKFYLNTPIITLFARLVISSAKEGFSQIGPVDFLQLQ